MNKATEILVLSFILVMIGLSLKAFTEESMSLLPPGELDSLLTRIEKELGDMESLQTEFVQKKHLSIFTTPVEAKGLLLFRKPKDIRFDITEPFQSSLIVRNGSVAKYEYTSDGWQKLNTMEGEAITRITDHLALWVQGHLREAGEVYAISATTDTNPLVIMTPIQTKFKEFIKQIEIELAFEPTRVVALTIREPNDDYTEIHFSNEKRNCEFPASYFDVNARVPETIALGN